jgi:hypothetical protein
MSANLLINKYFTPKSLFLKDLEKRAAKSLTLKDRTEGVSVTNQ